MVEITISMSISQNTDSHKPFCVLGAVVNNANDTFDVANYIYTTKGENIIHNDAENDVRNLRRNISGNITIATYK